MSDLIKIAVDAMGGDGSPKKIIDGIVHNHKSNQENFFNIFGNKEIIKNYIDKKINKKMKDYINLFHSMVSEIHFWNNLTKSEKLKKISLFLSDFENKQELLNYFNDFNLNLSKKTLNSYLKSVSNP